MHWAIPRRGWTGDYRHRPPLHRLRGLPRHLPGAGAGRRPPPAPRGPRPVHHVPGLHRGVPLGRHLRGGRVTSIHPIEAESYRIMAGRVDLSRFGPLGAAVVGRVIHASADVEYAETMVVDEAAVAAAMDALAAGAPVIVDVEMVRHGITGVPARCFLRD